MRRTLPGLDLALGEAVNRIRPIWEACPEPRPDLAGEAWDDLERLLDTAAGANDGPQAMRAIARWEERTRIVLERCTTGQAATPSAKRDAT